MQAPKEPFEVTVHQYRGIEDWYLSYRHSYVIQPVEVNTAGFIVVARRQNKGYENR